MSFVLKVIKLPVARERPLNFKGSSLEGNLFVTFVLVQKSLGAFISKYSLLTAALEKTEHP